MAKTYQFRFNAQPAEFYPGGVTVHYGLSRDTDLANEIKEMTWAEAQPYLLEFANKVSGPCAVFVKCLSKPVPPGYSKSTRHIYKEH